MTIFYNEIKNGKGLIPIKAIMKVKRERGGIQIADIPPPTPKSDEVVVQIRNASICGSDLHAYEYAPTHHYLEPPVIMGHECAGVVITAGSDVTAYKPGDRVVIEAILYCSSCDYCLRGSYHLCQNFKVRGMHQNGVFTEQVAVTTNYLHKIPDNLSFERACLVEPAAVAIHAVLDRSRIKPGDSVLVTGPGPIGLLSAQMVKAAGAEPIVAGIDADEEARLPAARAMGYQTINATHEAFPEAMKKLTGRETADWIVECSGAPSIVQKSLEVVVKGGGITLVGLFSKPVEADLTLAVRKEVSIHASCTYVWENFERAIALFDQGLIRTESLVSFYKPEDAVSAFEDAIAKKVSKPVFTF